MAPRIKRTFERYGEGALTTGSPLRTERVPIARLHPAPHNPRTIRDARFEQLKRSLAADPELLDARPIIALPSGEVVAGNMRLRAALALGWDAVPCITVDLDERRAREWMLKDNNAYGEWQEDDLAALVYDLGKQGADLPTLGFDDKELTRLLDSVGALGEADDVVPEPPTAPITRAGDLWLLGPHRLLCGDAAQPEDVARLMGGQTATAVLTDPPYGIEREGVPNDDPAGLAALYAGAIACLPVSDAAVVCFQSPRLFWTWLDAARSAGQRVERLLWMYKPNDETFPWRGWLLKSEAILVTSVGKAQWQDVHPYAHDVYSPTTLGAELEPGEGWHATVKPLKVVEDLLARTSARGALVYDPFLGSGTTLVAAHTLGRACYGMEIEPRYVDVAVRRWEHLTGDTARREASA